MKPKDVCSLIAMVLWLIVLWYASASWIQPRIEQKPASMKSKVPDLPVFSSTKD